MGGKKKKSLSTRLAKMSDEERARYLQHRAQIEEEAKRRKEQLIAIYLKKKLKKEEGFNRLNIAKINEYWHQILRKIKVKELKDEIEDMQSWITKVLEIKNKIITKLMLELQECEEQYGFNLNSHLCHLDDFLDIHFERQEYFKTDYVCKKDAILKDVHEEHKQLIEKSNNEEKYLKTILFSMETDHNNYIKQLHQFREIKFDDYSNSLEASYQAMLETYRISMETIWKDIHKLLCEYLAHTTQKKHHYIEMKHIDERNENERQKNDKCLEKYKNIIQTLKSDFTHLRVKNEKKIQQLVELKDRLCVEYREKKQNLTKTIKKDEKILQNMIVLSNETIETLKKILEKGTGIRNFVFCCTRLETSDEKLGQWAKIHGFENVEDVAEEVEDEEQTEEKSEEKSTDKSAEKSAEISTKISAEKSVEISAEKSAEISVEKSEIKLEEEIKELENDDLPEDLQIFSKLDGLWWSYNRIKIQIINLKHEKEELLKENKNMKDIIRSILREIAMEPPPPPEMKFPVCYKIFSSPVEAGQINLQGQDFLTIDF